MILAFQGISRAQSSEKDTASTTFSASWKEAKSNGYADKFFSGPYAADVGLAYLNGVGFRALYGYSIGTAARLVGRFHYNLVPTAIVAKSTGSYGSVIENELKMKLAYGFDFQVALFRNNGTLFYATGGYLMSISASKVTQNGYVVSNTSESYSLQTYSAGIGAMYCFSRKMAVGLDLRYTPFTDFSPVEAGLTIAYGLSQQY